MTEEPPASVAREITALTLADEADVFAARQLARDLATAVGLDRLDATRLATAISELARDAVAVTGGRLTFGVRGAGHLVARLSADGLAASSTSVRSARRLVDTMALEETGRRFVVELSMPAPPNAPAEWSVLAGTVAQHAVTSPLEELRQQNEELVTVLDTVRAKNVELETLNRELEETNRGVMALYTELSDELERTNQGVVALYAEIDEKNERLQSASEAKTRFLRSVSHELRTPVNSVLGLTRLLTDPGAGALSPEQAEQVEFIRVSASDLDTLVDELLNLARAESGGLEPVVRDVDLAALLGDLVALTTPLLREGVRLTVGPRPDDLVVRTDPDLVRHVMRNLLSNAAKFTAAGSVHVGVESEEGQIVIAVSDTGVGMTEDEQARAFEEFYQAQTPLHVTARGTGLGLPFARSVAIALGGDIEVASRPGAGSRFALRLPLTSSEASS